jgi:dolichyl-phosphate beta-glucosyltransferase
VRRAGAPLGRRSHGRAVVSTALVLPCYNEAARLDVEALQALFGSALERVVFVDDGSTDETAIVLGALAAEQSSPCSVLQLPINVGKGEAVRQGLRMAMEGGASVVGFADSDLATPVAEVLRLAMLMDALPDLGALLGSRVKLAGRLVERRAARHYLGRVIATYIDTRTGLSVYDTQCGVKFFRVTPELRAAVAEPFATRWLFDVELLRRLSLAHAASRYPLVLREEPLETWVDVDGSSIRGVELLRVARDFVRLERSMWWSASESTRQLDRVQLVEQVRGLSE